LPRIRTVKPEAPQHRKVGRLSDRAFRLWVTMLTQADDEGRLVADPGQLRIQAWGYHDEVSEKDAAAALEEIATSGLVHHYTVADVPYVWFPSWADHQRIHKNHFTPSKLPPPPPRVRTSPVAVPEESRTGPAGVEGNGSGVEGNGPERRGGEPEGRTEGEIALNGRQPRRINTSS
jgi:hypothetical protein